MQCKFTGEQHEFPWKPNLQYYKTCKLCTKKKAQQWQDQQANKPKCPAPGKDTTSGSLLTIAWDVFLMLLAENKMHAFDLHAFVSLDRKHAMLKVELGSEANMSSHQLAMHIARAVWNQTGFQFKYVMLDAASTMINTYFCKLASRSKQKAWGLHVPVGSSACTHFTVPNLKGNRQSQSWLWMCANSVHGWWWTTLNVMGGSTSSQWWASRCGGDLHHAPPESYFLYRHINFRRGDEWDWMVKRLTHGQGLKLLSTDIYWLYSTSDIPSTSVEVP